MKRTPLYNEHKKAGAVLINFFDWELPVYYTSIKEESMAVRRSAGLFDVSHMGEIFITGNEATEFVNYIITNSTYNKENNSIVYTLMCNNKGFAVDDLLVYKFNKNNFLLLVNASNIDKDFKWIKEQKGIFDVLIEDKSQEYSLLALQGPSGIDLLNEFFSFNVDELQYYNFTESRFNNINCLLSRTGYTGEKGFELLIRNEYVKDIWNFINGKKKQYDLKFCGLGARDLLRIEAGFPLYGHELNEHINPIEAGLRWVIKFNKEKNFIGKGNLLEYKNNNSKKRIGFVMEKTKIAREGSKIINNEDKEIGLVTSGTFSFNLNKSIGMGIIEKKYIDIQKLKITINQKFFYANIVDFPFIPLKN